MLPILAELEMHEESYVGVQMDLCSQRFNNLLVLRITSLVTLKRVTFPGVTTTRNEPIKPIFSDMQKIDCEAHVSCSFCNATGGPAHVEQHPPHAGPNATGGLADVGQHPQPAAPNATGSLADVGHLPPPAAGNATGSQADMGQHPQPSAGNNKAGQLGNEQSHTGGEATKEATKPSPVLNYPEVPLPRSRVYCSVILVIIVLFRGVRFIFTSVALIWWLSDDPGGNQSARPEGGQNK